MPEFRTLHEMLKPAPPVPDPPPIQESERCTHGAQALRDLTLFRLHVAEGVRACVDDLAADVAANVLARELQLQPCDIAAIVERALERFAHDEPVAVRVHPDDAAALSPSAITMLTDESLQRGDAILEVRYGSVDATFAARLNCMGFV